MYARISHSGITLGRLLWERKQTGFPFFVLKPPSSAVGSDGSFLFAAYTIKYVFFAHSTSPLPRALASSAQKILMHPHRGRTQNHVFFAVCEGCGREQEKPESCVGLNTTKRGNRFCFLFSDSIIVGLNPAGWRWF